MASLMAALLPMSPLLLLLVLEESFFLRLRLVLPPPPPAAAALDDDDDVDAFLDLDRLVEDLEDLDDDDDDDDLPVAPPRIIQSNASSLSLSFLERRCRPA